MIKAIITDLDGTLLPRGGSISSGSLEAFRLAGNKGCIRIIATGRNLYSALKILPEPKTIFLFPPFPLAVNRPLSQVLSFESFRL